jgi:hypothetical protein
LGPVDVQGSYLTARGADVFAEGTRLGKGALSGGTRTRVGTALTGTIVPGSLATGNLASGTVTTGTVTTGSRRRIAA